MQSIWSFVMAWYNLPFTILLAVCVMLAVLQWMGLGGEHESDADAGVTADADADADADMDADLHADFHADIHADADAHIEAHGEMEHGDGEAGFSVLAYLGMGRAPLMVILLILFGSVGLLGWTFNAVFVGLFPGYPGLLFGVTFLGSVMMGSLISSRLARLIGRALPPVSTTATAAQALVGRRGTVTSPFVDQKYGMIHLRDAGGTLISLFVVTLDGETIQRGEEVILVRYDPQQRRYEVVRAGL